MQAFAEGKPIEFRNKRSGSEWKVVNNPEWNWQYYNYRIKQDNISTYMAGILRTIQGCKQ